jgi:hypothetical protein
MPSAFMLLDRLPLTRNGKVDREALPPLEVAARMAPDAIPAGPSNGLQSMIVAAWRSVLDQESIGPGDHVFDLGANSVHVIQVFGRLRDAGVEGLAVLDLFRFPTAAGLAAFLAAGHEPALSVPDVQGMRQARQRLARRRGSTRDGLKPGGAQP